MRDQGGQMGPVHLRARFYVTFDIIGMQFDKAGNDKIPATIQCAGWDMIAFRNVTNHALFDGHGTGKHLIFQNKLRIGETQVA
jgi:hypothetical protein